VIYIDKYQIIIYRIVRREDCNMGIYDNKKHESLFARTLTKDELLNSEQYVKIENSEVPADRVNIERAVDRAIERMREQISLFSPSEE